MKFNETKGNKKSVRASKLDTMCPISRHIILTGLDVTTEPWMANVPC